MIGHRNIAFSLVPFSGYVYGPIKIIPLNKKVVIIYDIKIALNLILSSKWFGQLVQRNIRPLLAGVGAGVNL